MIENQVSAQGIDMEGLFMEPKLPNLENLVESDEVLPGMPSLDISDLPGMDVTSEAFRSTCASAYAFNEFLNLYHVSFEDRITLIKSILTITNGAVANTRNELERKQQEKYLAEGGKEYYGTYL